MARAVIAVFVILATVGFCACDDCEEDCEDLRDAAEAINNESADPSGSWTYDETCFDENGDFENFPPGSPESFFCSNYYEYKQCMEDC